jgi:hypothetical protein
MKNSTLAVLALLLFHSPIFAQQWSSDPVTDTLKKGTAALIKYQGWLDYCKGEHSHDKECAGIYDNIPWQYMDYAEALKLGQKQLDEAKAKKEQEAKPKPTVAEAARQYAVFKQLLNEIKDFCDKNPAVKSCRDPYQLAMELFPQVQKPQAQVQEAATPASAKKPTQ